MLYFTVKGATQRGQADFGPARQSVNAASQSICGEAGVVEVASWFAARWPVFPVTRHTVEVRGTHDWV